MTEQEIEAPRLSGWALVLGASSGFGAATALRLAKSGMNIIGIHLDRRKALPGVKALQEQIEACGSEAWFFNINASDADKRAATLQTITDKFAERGGNEQVRVLLHSLAFGSLGLYVTTDDTKPLTQKQIEMTQDVMAHSLVYWTQDLVAADLLEDGGRIFAMTSTGSTGVFPGYGAVSAAKASLEAHIRQLAYELAPKHITANAICAGAADTAALGKIPGGDTIQTRALERNPYKRLTTPEDVALTIAGLAHPCTYWMTGNVVYVDGGEGHVN